MKVYCVLILACAVVLQIADAKKEDKCNKYIDKMKKTYKDMRDKGEIPECSQQYSEYLDAILNTKNLEEKIEKRKEFYTKVMEMSDDEKEELFKCMNTVGYLVLSNVKEKPPQECMTSGKKKEKKNSKEEEE